MRIQLSEIHYICFKLKTDFMKKRLLIGLLLISAANLNAQQQIGNSGFETWETVGDGEEPTNWNSFETAQGDWSFFGGEQVGQSADIRPGSSGTKSAHVWSNEVAGVIANGNLTLGIINMGSTTASSSSNYNISLTANTSFSEVMTDEPDSLVFWVKFNPASNNTTDSARVKATIHDNYNYRDPEDANSLPHVYATAVKNYGKTNNAWVRMSIPFVYGGPAATGNFILMTFTTNKTPGLGSDNDQIWIDDVELIYNPEGNQQIVVNDDTFSGDQDGDIVCDVLANDVDPEGQIDESSVQVLSGPSNGTVLIDGGSGEITYTPNPGYSGPDSFTYNVCDEGAPATCGDGVVSITVNYVSVDEVSIENAIVYSNSNTLYFKGMDDVKANYVVYNLTGSLVAKGAVSPAVSFNERSGVYLVSIITDTTTVTKRIYKN